MSCQLLLTWFEHPNNNWRIVVFPILRCNQRSPLVAVSKKWSLVALFLLFKLSQEDFSCKSDFGVSIYLMLQKFSEPKVHTILKQLMMVSKYIELKLITLNVI